MSLGLNDLTKKRNPAKTSAKTAFAPGAVSAKSTTARPWSNDGLTKPSNRKSTVDTQAAMNEDWLSLHAESLFAVESAQDSIVGRVQEKLAQAEVVFEERILSPLKSMRNFWLPKRIAR